MIFCETDDHRYQLIKGLQQLNALQTNVDAAHNSSCTRNCSLRLGPHSGVFTPYPDDETHPDEASLGHAASFQVIEETPSRQVVEVRYNDGMTDIDDAMFRYAVENGTVTPLESRVLIRVMAGMFGEFVLLILVTLLIVGTGGVVR